MSDNNLTKITAGKTGFISQVNQLIDALVVNILPRSLAGVVTDAAGSLGDATRRFTRLFLSDGIHPFEIDGVAQGGVSSGFMMPFTGGTTAPTGWLRANGDTIGDTGSGATHEGPEFETLFEMYKVISTYGNAGTEVWASGDTVKIPDVASGNLFIRECGSSTIGTTQTDQNKAHTHGQNTTYDNGFGVQTTVNQIRQEASGGVTGSPSGSSTSFTGKLQMMTDSSGSSEVRVVNMGLPQMIKI